MAPKPATPEQYMMSIIGKEAQWVHESMIPIWLLRSYEEKVKREIALAQSLATRQAAQGKNLTLEFQGTKSLKFSKHAHINYKCIQF